MFTLSRSPRDIVGPSVHLIGVVSGSRGRFPPRLPRLTCVVPTSPGGAGPVSATRPAPAVTRGHDTSVCATSRVTVGVSHTARPTSVGSTESHGVSRCPTSR